jgi:hypothetical protein
VMVTSRLPRIVLVTCYDDSKHYDACDGNGCGDGDEDMGDDYADVDRLS